MFVLNTLNLYFLIQATFFRFSIIKLLIFVILALGTLFGNIFFQIPKTSMHCWESFLNTPVSFQRNGRSCHCVARTYLLIFLGSNQLVVPYKSHLASTITTTNPESFINFKLKLIMAFLLEWIGFTLNNYRSESCISTGLTRIR